MTEDQLFLAALDQPNASARNAYLDEACGNDAALRGKVESLLAAHFQSGEFLDIPAPEQVCIDTSPSCAVTIQSGNMSNHDNDEEIDDSQSLKFLAPSSRPDSLGRIGHYEVLQVLGKGGFGIVLRAFDDVLQRIVAIKVMAPQLAATSPARKRFLREARSSAQVRHENVVQVYEVGEHPLPFLVMEFIPGETLQQRIDRVGPLEVKEALQIGRQIAEGLAAAHAQDLIHRDIKPGNVLLEGAQHKVKITDFGLARAADDASMTQSGMIAGTPMYMAPEQALGQSLDQRADLFSLGSVLYQMVAGRPPFRASTTIAVLKRVADDAPRPIREVIPETPQWLCDIIAKLHAKKPDDRYQSAREVADVLADCEAQLKQSSRLQDFSRIPREKSAPRRTVRGTWAAAAGVLLLLLAAFWFGPSALLYLSNRGSLKLLPEEGLISVIVLENNEGDLVTDKLHTPMTDWLDLTEKSHTLRLPPGRYQLNVSTWPAGTRVSQWAISNTGLFGSDRVTVPVINTSAIVTVERGHRVTLRAVISKPAADPTLVSVAPETEGEWVQLFNGKDLTGWSTFDKQWTVRDGILVGQGTKGYVHTLREDFRDFHLRAEVKVAEGSNSGIYFRSSFVDKVRHGYEAEVSLTKEALQTGSLTKYPSKNWLLQQQRRQLLQHDRWCQVEIIAVGKHLVVKVDGNTTAELDDVDFERGHFGLQLSQDATSHVEFRKIEIKELPASPPPSDGFVQLFNGQDLTGWKTDPELPGHWEVKDGILVGSQRRGVLLSERGDFADFHLRVQVKINLGGDSGIFFRAGPKMPQDGGYEAEIHKNRGYARKTGTITVIQANGAPLVLGLVADDSLTKPDDWFELEVIAEGGHFITKINGQEAATCSVPANRHAVGQIGLQVWNPNTVVQFRKIEIKELTASAPEVPQRTVDILAFIQGTWNRDSVIVEPKQPPDKGRSFGQLTFERVASGKVMRGHTLDEHGRSTSLILHSYDSVKDQIRSWYFSAEGETNASNFGVYDPTSRSFSWLEKFPDGTQSIHELDFADANTVRARNYDLDAASNTVYASHATFTRTSQPPAVPNSAIDPKRPAEMKVLDRLVGEWRDEITVTIPGTPAQPKIEVQRTQARSILGGRMIETLTTNETTNSNDYSVLWYDVAAKRYRLWAFLGDGQAFELSGTWNETTQTIAFESSDGVRFGHTIFQGDDQHEFRRAAKNPAGKIVFDANGVARRVTPIGVPPLAVAPFDTAQAKKHQDAWATHLGVPVEYTNSIGMKFRLIPPGEFQMGSTPEEIEVALLEAAEINNAWKEHIQGEAPRHRVVLEQPFYLGIHEVTQAQYQQLMSANPNYFGPQGLGKDLVVGVDTARFPVEMVSWEDAANFCVRLSEQEAIPPCYSWDGELIKLREGTGYRLPSEAEWEFACRAGTSTKFWSGNEIENLMQIGWFGANSTGRPHPVGELPANPFGLHDMHGNIWEWVQDGWDPSFYASLSEQKSVSPLSPIDATAARGARGGNFYVPPMHCRAADRGAFDAKSIHGTVGFRAVLSVDAVKAAKTPTAVAPFTDADVQRIAALPAAEQVEEVRQELMRRNPGFDGTAKHKVEGGVVTELTFTPVKGQDALTDISPVRALTGLTSLNLWGCVGLEDLEPLKGMKLTRLIIGSLNVSLQVRDLEPLKGMKLTELQLYRCQVQNLEPLQDMPLTKLTLFSRHVRDCGPLTGLPLTTLGLAYCSQIEDFTPLADLPLTGLHLNDCQVRDLAPFKGMQLTELLLAGTPIRDLELLKGMPLKKLSIHRTGVTDLKPLQGMELDEIYLTPKSINRGLNILREMKSLKTIGIEYNQAWPAAEFWERYDKGEFAVAPFTEADTKRIAALPAPEQVEEVHAALMRLNPGFDGKVTPTIENGVVMEFSVNTDEILNVAPIRALTKLIYLDLRGTYPNKGKLADISPLRGMTISRLDCSSTQVSDLSPLADLPLTVLHINHNPVSDLSPLKKMPLENLGIAETQVADLSPLKGMQIKLLGAQLLPVTDLSPLAGMPLTGLDLYHTVGVTSLEPLRGMPLEGLNLQDVPVSDLSPLKGMTTLRTLVLQATKVSDLSPLADLKLTDLLMHGEQITDLSPLKGLPLTRLHIDGTGVSNLQPLAGMPLVEFRLNPKNITEGMDVVRGLKTIQTIGTPGNQTGKPEEFWERYDKGEFKE